MGVYTNIYIGAVIVAENKTVFKKEMLYRCPNHPDENIYDKSQKFCSKCGSAIVFSEFVVPEQFRFYNGNDDVFSIEYNTHYTIIMSNQKEGRIKFDIAGDSEFLDMDSFDKNVLIAEFINRFESYIKYLNDNSIKYQIKCGVFYYLY